MRAALPAPPVATAFYRMLFASLILAVGMGLRPRKPERDQPSSDGPAFGFAVLAGAFFGTDLALWHSAVVETSVANATLLVNTTPIYIGFFAILVQEERPGASFAIGAALALCGMAVLLDAGRSDGAGLRGDLLALAAAVFYSGYLLLMKAARNGLDVITAVFLASVSATAILGLYALWLGNPFSGFPAGSWAAMLGAALISQVGGVMAIAWALRDLPATFASVGLLTQPVAAALLGWWLLGESLSLVQTLGGGAVLAGIFVVSREHASQAR